MTASRDEAILGHRGLDYIGPGAVGRQPTATTESLPKEWAGDRGPMHKFCCASSPTRERTIRTPEGRGPISLILASA